MTSTTLIARGSLLAAARPRWRRTAPIDLLGLAMIAVAIVVLPVGVTILQAAQGGTAAAREAIKATSLHTLLLHTVLVAAIVTPAAGVIGVGTAWLVERTNLHGRKLWTLVLVAPLTIPLFVTSNAWAGLSPSLQGLLGACGILVFSYYPIVFLLVAASLRGLDPALEETARSLGLNARRTFFRVVLPQLRPALFGGLLLVALDTLVEFDAFVALRYQTFAVDVYSQYRLSFSTSGAAALSTLSIALCLVLLFGEARLRGNANYTRVSHGARRQPARYRLGRFMPLAIGSVALVAMTGLGIPLAMLVRWFTQGSDAALGGAAVSAGRLLPDTLTSVGLGAGAALLAIVLALPVAILAVRHRSAVVTVLERATYLSFALPDLVAAIALTYAASHYARFLFGSIALLLLANAMLFVPFAIVALRATLGQMEPVLDDCARSLGCGSWGTLRRITIPLARPGLAAAGVLVFAFVLGDLSTTQVLLPPDLSTLGIDFEANGSTVAFAAAAPFAAALIGLSMAAAYGLTSRFGRVRSLGAA